MFPNVHELTVVYGVARSNWLREVRYGFIDPNDYTGPERLERLAIAAIIENSAYFAAMLDAAKVVSRDVSVPYGITPPEPMITVDGRDID